MSYHQREGWTDDALGDFKKIVSTFPNYEETLNRIALGLIGHPTTFVEDAIEYQRRALFDAIAYVEEWSPEMRFAITSAFAALIWERIAELSQHTGTVAA